MRYITLTLLVISNFCFSQSSLLYEISGKGLKQSSYLFGTLHVQNEEAFNFNDSVFWAIDQCETAAFELDFNINSPDFDFDKTRLNELAKHMATTLIPAIMEAIPADTMAYTIVHRLIPLYKHLISSQFASNKRSVVVDQYLQSYSRSRGKDIMGIESYKEQFEAILGNDYNALSDGILELITNGQFFNNLQDYPTDINSLVESYANLDFNSICSKIDQVGDLSNPLSAALYSRIFTDRNEIMYNRTKDLILEESIFIAVGCGHLCGEDGLVERYKKLGYTVRPINLRNKKAGLNVKWDTQVLNDFQVEIPEAHITESEIAYVEDIELVEIDRPYQPTFSIPLSTSDIFTSLGTVNFSVRRTIPIAETESVDNAVDDYEMDESDVYYDDADAVDTYDEDDTDYIIEVEEAVEEYYDDVEIDDEVMIDSDIEYEIIYEEAEADHMIIYDSEEDEIAYDPYDADDEMENYREEDEFFRIQDYITEDMKAYAERVKELVTDEMQNITEEMTSNVMSFMLTSTVDTLYYKDANGVKQEAYLTKSILTSTLTTTIISNQDVYYELRVTGDNQALRSKDVLRFFSSFKLID